MKLFNAIIILLFVLFESIVILELNKESKKYELDRLSKTIELINMKEEIGSENINQVPTVNYSTNYKHIINNHVAQYSSYILIETDEFKNTTYKISFLFQLSSKSEDKLYLRKEDFLCLIKSKNLNKAKYVKLEPFSMLLKTKEKTKKVTCKANFLDSLDLKELVVAIIWKQDFNETLNLEPFNEKFNGFVSEQVLPYDLIKYQIPTIIQNTNPRIKSVGLCVHYTHKMPSYIINWIDNNLAFGINNVIFYDATDNNELKRTITDHYGNMEKIKVRPYDITYDSLCNEKHLLEQFNSLNLSDKLIKYFIDSCERYYLRNYQDKYKLRLDHEELTVNDCFTELKQKYELIAHFDLDEVIFPRNFKNTEDFYDKNEDYTCNSVSKICSSKVFSNSYNQAKSVGIKDNYLYNYVWLLINSKLLDGFELDKMSSIFFRESSYLIPNIDERKLIIQLEKFLKDSDSKMFPYELTLSSPPYTDFHTFIIEREDISYVQYLYDSYSKFISCIYENYLNKTAQIDKSLVRYLYFTTEKNQRQPKVIHFYKNVNTIATHRPTNFLNGTWKIEAEFKNGYFFSHFRNDLADVYTANAKGSIRKLNIDFEYVFFLLQKYTNFCENYQ